MKYKILIPILFICIGCKKDEITGFSDYAAINITKNKIEYSFIHNNKAEKDTVYVPLRIIGETKNYDREVAMEIVADSLTTAEPSEYRYIDGYVKAGAFDGVLRFEVFKKPELDTSSLAVHIRITDSKDFKTGNTESSECIISWTNTLIRPPYWNRIRIFFCLQYSTEVYRRIIEATGISDFSSCYQIMDQMIVYGTQFGDLVKKYEREGNPLIHDDGPYKGRKIVPRYWTY